MEEPRFRIRIVVFWVISLVPEDRGEIFLRNAGKLLHYSEHHDPPFQVVRISDLTQIESVREQRRY
jgi:hypothetical protein